MVPVVRWGCGGTDSGQASPGGRTVFCSHVVEHQARGLKSTTDGVPYSSGKLARYGVKSLDLSACLTRGSQ